MKIPRFVIAGERSGVGKSLITTGILLSLKERGLSVQPFKVGPDFLDPMHHNIVTGNKSRNLDTWMFEESILEIFLKASEKKDISVIEGVMGFYDGIDGVNEKGSTAHLSKLLKSPVILVLDSRGSARSLGAIAMGFQKYDTDVNIAGVIFNNIGSDKHLNYLKQSLRGVECLGGIPRVKEEILYSRHLGLVPPDELYNPEKYEIIKGLVQDNVNIDRLIEISKNAEELEYTGRSLFGKEDKKIKIGVAFDSAFNFYYWDNFEILKSYGADIEFFSPLTGKLPDVDGIYMGGGYPEIFAKELEANKSSMATVREKSEDEMPIYAECGSLMYLCKRLVNLDGKSFKMVGIFDADIEMTERRQALGYAEVKVTKDNILSKNNDIIRGHEFHYSRVSSLNEDNFAYEMKRGVGIQDGKDGLVSKKTIASYLHIHFATSPEIPQKFISSCLKYSKK